MKTSKRLVWVFLLSGWWIMYEYYRERYHVNHFWELQRLAHPFEIFTHLFEWLSKLFEWLSKLFEWLIKPFKLFIHPFKRFAHLFEIFTHPLEWLTKPFKPFIHPFERLGKLFECFKDSSLTIHYYWPMRVLRPSSAIMLLSHWI